MTSDTVRPVAIAITGATTTGKTALSLSVAEALGGEIISMDSRQIYRGMDIGTDKVDAVSRGRVPHHGLDLLQPTERYSAGAFARDARRWIAEIEARGRVPILAGGTGFFLRSLTAPLFEQPRLDPARRRALAESLERLPGDELARWVARLDPHRVAEGDVIGRQRALRTLEVALLTGRPLSWWHRHAPPEEAPVPVLVFLLELPRDRLYRQIDARVTRMLDRGLVDEVSGLLDQGVPEDAPGMTGTGYREIAAYLSGEATLEESAESIRSATRGYARRQLTWFRHQLASQRTVALDATRPVEVLVEEIVEAWLRRTADEGDGGG